MTTSVELGSKELAVVDAIISLRLDGDSDIFEYDCKEVQKYLNQSGDSKKHIITLDIQREIVKDLSEREILNTDQIIDNRFDNIFRLRIGPQYIDEPRTCPDFSWANQTYWAREKFQESGTLSIEEAYVKYGGGLFIKMATEDIDNINYTFKAIHEVQLAFDKRNPHLVIKIEDEDWECISRLDANQSPYKILKYVCANPNRRITRKELAEKKVVNESRSLKSQVFSDNEKVKALIPLLIEIDSDGILFRRSVMLTLCELDKLKTALKI